jgi:hypothetical protein
MSECGDTRIQRLRNGGGGDPWQRHSACRGDGGHYGAALGQDQVHERDHYDTGRQRDGGRDGGRGAGDGLRPGG